MNSGVCVIVNCDKSKQHRYTYLLVQEKKIKKGSLGRCSLVVNDTPVEGIVIKSGTQEECLEELRGAEFANFVPSSSHNSKHSYPEFPRLQTKRVFIKFNM